MEGNYYFKISNEWFTPVNGTFRTAVSFIISKQMQKVMECFKAIC